MRAVVYRGPGRLELAHLPRPTPGPGELVVRVHAALTCGTDLKTYRRGHPLIPPGTVLGHEFAGRVEAAGEGVAFAPGDWVVAANSAPCGQCFWCASDQESLCQRLEARLNFGAFAQAIRLPAPIVARNTYPVPEGLAPEEAAMIEPLACVVHGQELVGVRPGETVAILGGSGAIGLLHLQLALRAGAGRVLSVGRSPRRLAVARQLGADETLSALEEDPVEAIRRRTEGRGADLVIEAVGKPEVWEMAVAACRRGGRVLLFGGCPAGTQVPLDAGRVHYGQLSLFGAFHHTPATVARALELLARGEVRAAPLLTHRLPLERAAEALELMERGEAVKVVLEPGEGLDWQA